MNRVTVPGDTEERWGVHARGRAMIEGDNTVIEDKVGVSITSNESDESAVIVVDRPDWIILDTDAENESETA